MADVISFNNPNQIHFWRVPPANRLCGSFGATKTQSDVQQTPLGHNHPYERPVGKQMESSGETTIHQSEMRSFGKASITKLPSNSI